MWRWGKVNVFSSLNTDLEVLYINADEIKKYQLARDGIEQLTGIPQIEKAQLN